MCHVALVDSDGCERNKSEGSSNNDENTTVVEFQGFRVFSLGFISHMNQIHILSSIFIYLRKYSVSLYYVLGTILGTRGIAVIKN